VSVTPKPFIEVVLAADASAYLVVVNGRTVRSFLRLRPAIKYAKKLERERKYRSQIFWCNA
jgi:hypothetical protein